MVGSAPFNSNRSLENEGNITTDVYASVAGCLGVHCLAPSTAKKDRDANSKGTMLLLRVQLIEYHAKYMKEGEIPSYAYDNFSEMYDAYHALGGNGMITKMYKEIQELHFRNGGRQ